MAVQVHPAHVAVELRQGTLRGERGGVALGQPDHVVDVVAGDRRGHELDRANARARVVGGRERHLAGPAGVDVAGEEHGVAPPGVADHLEQAAALPGVAVPLVGVVGDALARDAQQLGERGGGPRLERGQEHGRDHHRVADDVPARGRGAQATGQPVELLGAGHGARDVDRVAVEPARHGGAVGPQVEHAQLGQRPPAQPPVEVPAVAQGLRPHGHPLEVGLRAGGLAVGERALVRLVVLGPARPGVVGHLVVVPRADPRHVRVQRLQVRVGAVLRQPDPVVGQGDDLVGRLVRADGPGLAHVLAAAVLVDVVAQLDDRVQVPAGLEVAVAGEEPGLPVGTRHHPDAPAPGGGRRAVGGGGAGAAGGRGLPEGAEAVVVPAVGGQAGAVDLDGVVAAGVGDERARPDDAREAGVEGDLPTDDDGGAQTRPGSGLGGGRDPRPQDEAVRHRVAGRDAVPEDALGRGGDGGPARDSARAGRRGPGQGARPEDGPAIEAGGGVGAVGGRGHDHAASLTCSRKGRGRKGRVVIGRSPREPVTISSAEDRPRRQSPPARSSAAWTGTARASRPTRAATGCDGRRPWSR